QRQSRARRAGCADRFQERSVDAAPAGDAVKKPGSLFCGLLALFTPACWGDNEQIGNTEPFRVQGPQVQFVRGRFIGRALEDGGAKPPEPVVVGPPITTSPISNQGAFYQGQSGVSFTGEASTNAASIGLWLQGVGHGYWVFPVGGPEATKGLLTW